jgi:hypothetical protein
LYGSFFPPLQKLFAYSAMKSFEPQSWQRKGDRNSEIH